jgi:pSer/pThr/pTyr-binding forkhead associated (FHA) protein
MDKLILNFKESTLKEYPMDKDSFTIGRKPENDIQIDNPVVSGKHARIFKEGRKVVLEDLGSTNGTFVNKKKISKCELKHKDIVFIGKHTIVFLSDDPVAQLEASAAEEDDLDATMVLQTKAHAKMTGASKAGLGGLTVIDGTADKPEYELTARLSTIGKAETSTVKIKGLLAPKTAALINRGNNGYVIAPPGSGGKVSVNGQGLTGRRPLKDGDVIELYGVKLQFYLNS